MFHHAPGEAKDDDSLRFLRSCANHSCNKLVSKFDEADFAARCTGYFPFRGLTLAPSFLSADEEQQIVSFCDSSGQWVISQSGRAKIDWTASMPNFKKRKMKVNPEFLAMPLPMKPFITAVSAAVTSLLGSAADVTTECKLSKYSNCSNGIVVPEEDKEAKEIARSRTCGCYIKCAAATGRAKDSDDDNDKGDEAAAQTKAAAAAAGACHEFKIVGAAVLDYKPSTTGAHLAPHLDDAYFYGSRIVGVSLLSDSVMTFVQKVVVTSPSDDDGKTAAAALEPKTGIISVRVPLLQRSLYVMSGAVRYHWLHGIEARDIVYARRVSITLREPSLTFIGDHAEVANQLVHLANRFA